MTGTSTKRARSAAAQASRRLRRQVYRQNRRARRLGAQGRFTACQWRRLCLRARGLCLCCGEAKPLTVDHVQPLDAGGTNWITNIQPLCHECNTAKGDSVQDFRPAARVRRARGAQLP